MMKVYFFKRKPWHIHFSLEALFQNIIAHLPAEVKPKVIECSKYNRGAINKLYNVFEILFKKQGDINHITGDVHYIAFFMKKRKTILTVHDVNLLYTKNKVKRWIQNWFWLRGPIMRSQVVTVISQTTRKEVLKYAKCSPEKVHVIYNCISPDFKPTPKPFNKQKPVILHIGSKPNKNLKGLAQALEGISCRLEIVGEPTDAEIQLLKSLNIDYHIESGLTHQEMIAKYISCDIVSLVSFYEGFGLPIIEANTIERVVLTSNTSCMPEIAGNAACFVDPHEVASIRDGLLKIIEDENFRDTLLEKGKINRKRFSPAEIARQYAALYHTVLKRAGKEKVLLAQPAYI